MRTLGMYFSRYILSRLNILDDATRGYGGQIQERSLYEQLLDLTGDSAQAVQLIKWGLVTRFLVARSTSLSGGFLIDRTIISPWRSKSNGESTPFNTATAAPSVSRVNSQNKRR